MLEAGVGQTAGGAAESRAAAGAWSVHQPIIKEERQAGRQRREVESPPLLLLPGPDANLCACLPSGVD